MFCKIIPQMNSKIAAEEKKNLVKREGKKEL